MPFFSKAAVTFEDFPISDIGKLVQLRYLTGRTFLKYLKIDYEAVKNRKLITLPIVGGKL